MAEYKVIFEGQDKLSPVLDKVDAKVKKIGDDLKKVGGSKVKSTTDDIAKGINKAAAATDKLKNSLAKIKGPSGLDRFTRGLEASFKRLEVSAGRVGEKIGRSIGAGINKARRAVAGAARNLGGRAAGIGGQIGSGLTSLLPSSVLSVSAAVAALGGAILGLGRNVTTTLDVIDEVADRAAAINISVQGLQAIRESQKRAGIEPGQTDIGLLTLQQQLGKGFSDKSFEDLQNFLNSGLGKGGFKKFDKEIKSAKDTGQAYLLLVSYLNQALESGKKGTSSAELSKALGPIFGRGGKSMIDIIKGGLQGLAGIAEEMTRAGSLFGTADIDSANKMEQSFGRFSLAWDGLLLSLARPGFDLAINGFSKIADVLNEISAQAGVEVTGPFAELQSWIDSIDPKQAAALIKEKFNDLKNTLSEIWSGISGVLGWMDKFTAAPFLSDSVATKGPNQGLPERQGKFAMILDPIKAALTSVLDTVAEKITSAIIDGFNRVKEILSGSWNDLVNSRFGTLFGLKGPPDGKSANQPGTVQKITDFAKGVITNSGRGGAKTTVVLEDGTTKPGSRGYKPPEPQAPSSGRDMAGFASAMAAQRADLVGASKMMSDMSTIAASGIKLSGTDLVNSISSLAAQIRAVSIPQAIATNPGQIKYAQPNQRVNPSNGPAAGNAF